ncbi:MULTISPECIES: hypothetical protein [unclassified Luteococcus]|uniref:hypothetical protein n=1 Tax=unclassified Luteococcus TaxID=2639923 RepID=UPI00313BEA42
MRSEQETTITYAADDELVKAFTCLPRDLRKFKRDKRWAQIAGGTYKDGTEWGEFTCPSDGFNPVRAAKSSRPMTDEQRAASAARLAAAREAVAS